MSSSIAIPKRKKNKGVARPQAEAGPSSTSYSSSVQSSSTGEPGSPGAGPSSASGSPSGPSGFLHARRPSLLSESLAKTEYTVVNVGHPDAPRLITCVKSSQGFEWNHDIFLPSYASTGNTSRDLEHKRDPVMDIHVSDEEIASMFPQ